jgi:hypothetical protein
LGGATTTATTTTTTTTKVFGTERKKTVFGLTAAK